MEECEWKKRIAGIFILFLTITSLFSLLGRICSLLNFLNSTVKVFLVKNSLWLIVAGLIIWMLIMYTKKLNHGVYFNPLHNADICIATGVLIGIDGLIKLSSSLPIHVMSIKSMLDTLPFMSVKIEGMFTRNLLSNLTQVVLVLLQIVLGFYMVKINERKKLRN